jgi:hypothetical protein
MKRFSRLHAAYAEQKTARNPHPASGHMLWGYYEASKKLDGETCRKK